MRVAAWLAVHRVSRGYTQSVAADAIGLPIASLAMAESGMRRVTDATWHKLSRAYARPEWEIGFVRSWAPMAPLIWPTDVLTANLDFAARAHAAVAAALADAIARREAEASASGKAWAISYVGALRVMSAVYSRDHQLPATRWGALLEEREQERLGQVRTNAIWHAEVATGPEDVPTDEEGAHADEIDFCRWLTMIDSDLLTVRYEARTAYVRRGAAASLPPPLAAPEM